MNNNNLFIAMSLSLAILIGFHYFYERPRLEAYRLAQAQQAAKAKAAPDALIKNAPPAPALDPAPVQNRETLIFAAKRAPITAAHVRGSINLTGARFDDLTLPDYREEVDPKSPAITLLSPSGSARPHPGYYAEFGWLAENNPGLPDAHTVWQTGGAVLTPAQPLILRWDNGQGLRFERKIMLDDHYMFTITDSIVNDGNQPLTLHPYALIVQQTKPDAKNLLTGHVGPMGVLGGVLREHGYDQMIETPEAAESSIGGWLGIADKYWLVALIPPPQDNITANFKYAHHDGQKPEDGRFQVDYRGAPVTVAAKGTAEYTSRFFAGAKQVELLDHYRDHYGIEKFDLAIDFGWFRFLTKPLLYALNWLGGRIGNVGLAILALTVLVKLLVLPLGVRSFSSMAKMKKLQPELQRLTERFKDDKARQSIEMMELYRREKVSPLSGCVPILAQLPIFFALYKVLYIGIDMRHAPFFGWIRDLSAPDPTSFFNLFGLLPWAVPNLSLLHIGVWPVLMGLSMFGLQKMTPQPPDPVQAQVLMMMPLIFTIMLAPNMASGLIIYWTWSNIISIVQQLLIYRRMGVKAG